MLSYVGDTMSNLLHQTWGDAFTEGNAWHYTWSVFHDPEGLIRLMGGKRSMYSMG